MTHQAMVHSFDNDPSPVFLYHSFDVSTNCFPATSCGLGGVMEAACRGAKEKGGMVVGILPQEDMSYANPYCDIIVPTGMGFSRNYVTAYSADSAIVVGGGAGTYVEALVAYQKGKPIVALKGTGGTADKIADSYLDDRKTVKVMAAPTPKDAVDQALDHALNGKRR